MEYFDEINGAKVRDTEAREEIAKLKEGGGALFKHFWLLQDQTSGTHLSGYYLDKNSDTIPEQVELAGGMLDLEKLFNQYDVDLEIKNKFFESEET